MPHTPQKKSVEEVVRELADLIWNQNGKHSHINLDEAIRKSITTILAEREAELVQRVMETKRDIKTAVDVAADPSEWSSTMIVHNTAIDQALTIIKEVFKKQS